MKKSILYIIGILMFFALLFYLAFGSWGIERQYRETLEEIGKETKELKRDYRNTVSEKQRGEIIKKARKFVYKTIIDDLFTLWYGTGWDFNGTTEVPHMGKIACGYFVSTVLRDAGFKVERNTLAQQSSEKIVKSFAPEGAIKRFRNVEVNEFANAVAGLGDGLYLVGLDTHVGFMVVEEGNPRFVHSSYSFFGGVKSERPSDAEVMVKSKYRVVGKILEDKAIMQKWIKGSKIRTNLK